MVGLWVRDIICDCGAGPSSRRIMITPFHALVLVSSTPPPFTMQHAAGLEILKSCLGLQACSVQETVEHGQDA